MSRVGFGIYRLSAMTAAPMSEKVFQCFPWYKRCKDRGKARHCPAKACQNASCSFPIPSIETAPQFAPTSHAGDEAGGVVYISHKARVAYRHQMDGNVIDTTY
ncbi:hypothetical protein DPEC_G00238450 [Dallia pectoralis]|uniref:Uncharacterized protein n=1 Tax=Dallia pectoralis TaxID=75939 RepID=A0ACC2FZ39_DALPE|nr:hypothetical protein DPEC_G00238450 [Dallia pectoralis]